MAAGAEIRAVRDMGANLSDSRYLLCMRTLAQSCSAALRLLQAPEAAPSLPNWTTLYCSGRLSSSPHTHTQTQTHTHIKQAYPQHRTT
ncbi:hypothetical protein E2C01_071299 [Portunus trituberculatus]|uniref:Uncharacterized protein n=1 Tax=Portunus trituberculatus TaxID=210409 RepID=A0A5B7I427_PORTR|nr:hypothetical protein [Portunus trituberculatus]